MITVPTLLLDESRSRANLERMSARARAARVQFRPHFKSHQSQAVGRWFRDYGVDRITVSSLRMAEYFAADGWTDITVAFPVNVLEIDRINALAARIQLHILIESTTVVPILNENLRHAVGTWIKIDAGYGRTGLAVSDYESIDRILLAIDNSPLLEAKGFLAHAGHSYDARGEGEISAVHEAHTTALFALRKHYDHRPDLAISTGDTPTCSTQKDFGPADEIRPGNFVFYDLAQEQIGSCRIDQIAVAMACPVVALHPEREAVIIYGGGVHFSKDHIQHPLYGKCYGLVAEQQGLQWKDPIPGVFVQKLSQEHGTIKAPVSFIEQLAIGDTLTILPAHSCMTANLHPTYQLVDGRAITRWSTTQRNTI